MISVYLIIFLFALLCMSLYLNKNILSPSNVLISSFILAAMCNLMIMLDLNEDISIITMLLIILFNFIFMIFSTISGISKENHVENTFKLEFIDIKKWKIFIVILFQITSISLFIYKYKQIFGMITPETLTMYRDYALNNHLNGIPSWIMTICNISKMSSYVSLYVLINNIFSNKKDKILSILLITSSLLFIPIPLLNASRFEIVNFSLFFVFVFIFFQINSGKKWIRSFVLLLIVLIVLFTGFSYVGSMIGRSNGDSSGFVYYFGGGITCFDSYIKHIVFFSDVYNYFGALSFQNVYKLFSKILIVNNSSAPFPFLYLNGKKIGNVYTGLGAYYHDFGTFGIIGISSFFGTFFGLFFKHIRSVKLKGINMSVLVYFFLTFTLVFSPFSEMMSSNILSAGFFVNVFIMYAVSRFYIE